MRGVVVAPSHKRLHLLFFMDFVAFHRVSGCSSLSYARAANERGDLSATPFPSGSALQRRSIACLKHPLLCGPGCFRGTSPLLESMVRLPPGGKNESAGQGMPF